VADRSGNVVANPIFANGRSPSQVYLTSIVGVPWQAITHTDGSGSPDISAGLKSAAELAAEGSDGTCTWSHILGDPAEYIAPLDAHMIESPDPRSALAAPGSDYDADPIHGHDYSIPQRDDLQYACIMPLTTSRDCVGQQNCDCNNPSNDSPLCQDPVSNQFGTTQYAAKAYPGRRHLQVVRALDHQGIVGSICAPQLNNSASPGYAYRMVFDNVAQSVKRSLATP
jgi:hypothetical protein